MIFQTYGVSSHHDGHSYVSSMGLWFLLHTVCCNCYKRVDRHNSLLCSLCSAPVLQWPQKMTSQYQQGLSFYTIDTFFCHRVDIHHFGCHHQSFVWVVLVPGNHNCFWGIWLVCSGKYPSTHLMTRWWTNFCQQYPWSWVGQGNMSAQMEVLCRPQQSLACMTAERLCSFAWLCQWQKLCPASDNHGCVADLSVLWLLIQTCLSQSKCVWGAVQDYMGYSCSSV